MLFVIISLISLNMIRKVSNFFLIFTVISSGIGQEEQQLLEQSLVSYSQCRIDSDCTKKSNHSFCYNNDAGVIGVCKCLEGYDLISRNKTSFACLGPAKYGETCERNRQCQLTLTENAECSSGICQCKTGNHLFSDGRCYVSVLLDEFCRSDGNCWMSDGSFGNCVSGRCTCKFDKQVPTDDRLGCIDARGLGERCDNDRQCSVVPNAVCRVDCKCNTRYTLSRDQKRCLEAATEFDDMCEENDQCSTFLKGSVCKNGTCTCEVGQHGVATRCIRTLSIAESCTRDEECAPPRHLGSILCTSGYCKCAPGVINESIGCDSCVFYCNFVLLLASLVCTFLGLR